MVRSHRSPCQVPGRCGSAANEPVTGLAASFRHGTMGFAGGGLG